MSDRVVQSDHDSDGMAKESLHLYQSDWMAHWMQTSCKAEPDPLSLHCPYREEGDSKTLGPEISPSISKSSKRIREFSESRTDNTMNEILKLGSGKFGNERLESRSFPKFNLTQNRDTLMAPMDVTTGHGVVSKMGTSSGGGHFQHEGVRGNLEEQVESHVESLQKKSLAVSTSFQHDIGSSSKIVPDGYISGKSCVHSFAWQQEELNKPSHFVTSKEHWKSTKFQSYSTSLVHEKKINNPLDFRRSGTSSSRQNSMPLVLHDPSASKNQLPVFVGKQFKDLQNHYDTRSIPNWSGPLDATKSKTLIHDFFSVAKGPGSPPDVETVGICTTLAPMDELSGHPSKFSQTTHNFMITKKTGVSLPEGGEIFRDSTFCTNLKGKMLNQFLSLSPGFHFPVQHGVKLQPLGSSTDSEGKENFGDVKTSTVCLKNESSAETDTMDMDVFQKGHFSGVVLSPTNEIKKSSQVSSTSQAVLAPSTEETGGRLPNTELPDINEGLPAVPAVPSSVDDREISTSRTQSLDMDHLLSHAELPTNSKSIAFQGGNVELGPSISWVKRLKLSASGTFVHGTKSSTMEEASSHKKVNKFYNKIMRCSKNSSEPTMRKFPGREPMALGQIAVLSGNGEPSSTESVWKTQDVTPFNPWIRRWCHHRGSSPTQNHELLVVCEPQSSNAALEAFQKKQFPSIAAMALMGKALNSFQPCEFRNRGTYIVWNT